MTAIIIIVLVFSGMAAILMLKSNRRDNKAENSTSEQSQEEPAWKKHNREFKERYSFARNNKKEPDPEMVERMAKLRERKAQVKQEREAAAEQARQEALRKKEEALRKKEEARLFQEECERKYREWKEKRNAEMKELGLSLLGEDDDESLFIRANENVDIDKLFDWLHNYVQEDESGGALIVGSSGAEIRFPLILHMGQGLLSMVL